MDLNGLVLGSLLLPNYIHGFDFAARSTITKFLSDKKKTVVGIVRLRRTTEGHMKKTHLVTLILPNEV